jgi:hypothetical protein
MFEQAPPALVPYQREREASRGGTGRRGPRLELPQRLACEGKRMACERRARCRNSVMVFSSESGWPLPNRRDTTMTYFSDRLVSANKLIIAAAVIYTGTVTFARAMPPAQAQACAIAQANPSNDEFARLCRDPVKAGKILNGMATGEREYVKQHKH